MLALMFVQIGEERLSVFVLRTHVIVVVVVVVVVVLGEGRDRVEILKWTEFAKRRFPSSIYRFSRPQMNISTMNGLTELMVVIIHLMEKVVVLVTVMVKRMMIVVGVVMMNVCRN